MKVFRYDIWIDNKKMSFGEIKESEIPEELSSKLKWDRGNRIDIPENNHTVFFTDTLEKMTFLQGGLSEMFYLIRDGLLKDPEQAKELMKVRNNDTIIQ